MMSSLDGYGTPISPPLPTPHCMCIHITPSSTYVYRTNTPAPGVTIDPYHQGEH